MTYRNLTFSLVLFLFTVAPFAVSAQAGSDTAPDELFKLGNESMNAGQVAKAIDYYKQCVDKRPDFKEAWYNLGIAYSRKKEFDKEIDAYEKAIQAKPEPYTKALYNLAIAYEDKGVNEKAIGNYKKVIAAEPKAVDARINLGILYARTGDYDNAIEAYLKAIEQDGQVADAYFNLGIAYGRKAGKTTDESSRSALIKNEINAYGKAVEKNNKAHKAWYNMGIAHGKLHEREKEISAYLKAVEAKPEYPQALFNLVLAYRDKKQYEQALKHGEKYISVAESLTSEKKHLETVKELLNALKSGNKQTPTTPEKQTPPPTAPKK